MYRHWHRLCSTRIYWLNSKAYGSEDRVPAQWALSIFGDLACMGWQGLACSTILNSSNSAAGPLSNSRLHRIPDKVCKAHFRTAETSDHHNWRASKRGWCVILLCPAYVCLPPSLHRRCLGACRAFVARTPWSVTDGSDHQALVDFGDLITWI